jgi:hypothetical protein
VWEQLLAVLPKLSQLQTCRIENASAIFAQLARACAAKKRCLKLVSE